MSAPNRCIRCGARDPAFIGVYVPHDHRLPRSLYRLCEGCYPPTQETLDRIEQRAEASYSKHSLVAGHS
jgi:hypothetical protein